jgi:hypothetical protein
MMRHVLLLLLTLGICAAPHRGGVAQWTASPRPGAENSTSSEPLTALVSRLEGAPAVAYRRGGAATRLSAVRAEGCVFKYKVTREWERLIPSPPDRPQDAAGTIYRTVDEFVVDFAELDPSGVSIKNSAELERGAWVSFSSAEGKRAVSRTWLERSRLGVWVKTERQRVGYFPLRDDGGLEGAAQALRRAIAACSVPSK